MYISMNSDYISLLQHFYPATTSIFDRFAVTYAKMMPSQWVVDFGSVVAIFLTIRCTIRADVKALCVFLTIKHPSLTTDDLRETGYLPPRADDVVRQTAGPAHGQQGSESDNGGCAV